MAASKEGRHNGGKAGPLRLAHYLWGLQARRRSTTLLLTMAAAAQERKQQRPQGPVRSRRLKATAPLRRCCLSFRALPLLAGLECVNVKDAL